MKQAAAIVGLVVLLLGCGGGGGGGGDQDTAGGGNLPPDIADYVPPFKIAIDPAVFRLNQQVAGTVSFTAPVVCRDHGLVLRLYEGSSPAGEPTFDSPYLEQTWVAFDPAPSPGTKVDLPIQPFVVPSPPVQELYMVLWNWCEVRIPKGIDQNGNIIWHIKVIGTKIGGQSFRWDCPASPQNPAALCAYKS